MSDYKLVYILGAGHCGSTLLNLLLNGHSKIIGLSEIQIVGQSFEVEDLFGKDEQTDTFWQNVETCYEVSTGKPFRAINIYHPSAKKVFTWSQKQIKCWLETNLDSFKCISTISSSSILVDASKTWHRLYLLEKSRTSDIFVIHLIRDGRAIVNSYYRKYKDLRGLRKWLITGLMAVVLRRKFRKEQWLQVRYEQLAKHPEDTLKQICSCLDIDFEPQMLLYRQKTSIGVGGNRMINEDSQLIVLDEKWKEELTMANRLKFAIFGGWLNKYYGY